MPRPRTPRLSVTPLEDRITPYVFGADDRVVADTASGNTFRTGSNSVVRLEMQFPNGKQYFGSGTFVGGYYHVLTAAHNVYSKEDGGYASHILVTNPAVAGGQLSSVRGRAAMWRAETEYVNSGDLSYDLGLITLERGNEAGLYYTGGALPMEAATDTQLSARPAVTTLGFPGDKSTNGVTKYTAPGTVAGYTARAITSQADIKKGQSGGPILRPSRQTGTNQFGDPIYDQPAVWGVVSHEYTDGSRPNVFTRLTASRISVLKKAIADDEAYYRSLPPLPPGQLTITYTPPGANGFRSGVTRTSPPAAPAATIPPIPSPDPTAVPVAVPTELTEGNAADWTATTDWPGATNSLRDDTTRKLAGGSALALTTTSGNDVKLAYTVPAGVYDVTGFRTVHFFASAENGSPNLFQSGSPWVRLVDADGDAATYQFFANGNPQDVLNGAVGTWKLFDIPLAVGGDVRDGWRRTDVGSVDLRRVKTVEVHADTWDTGYKLWLDDLGFRGYPLPGAGPVVLVNAPPAPFGPGANPDATTALVKGLYRTVLGRDAEAPGLAGWVAAMTGGMTPAQAARGFWNSPENRAQQVDEYYRVFLGRQPDAGGRQHWMDILLDGRLDERGVAEQFLQSPEMIARGGTTGGYVDLLYTTVLGRPSDAAGRAFWVGQLDSGRLTRPQVVQSFVRSGESYDRIVRAFYRAYLRRDASTEDVARWRDAILAGAYTPASAAWVFLSCPEFQAGAAGAVG
jgi:V8-like Glu-specific endopeptidase